MATRDEFVELRIHGVSGTPPASMLGLEAQPVDPAPDTCGRENTDEKVKVQTYRQPRIEPDLRGYSWGTFTSGRPSTALWILLLPYVFANLAGWVAVPLDGNPASAGNGGDRPASVRWNTLLVRLAGVLVTVLMAVLGALTIADVVMYQKVSNRAGPGWSTAGGILLAAVAIWLVFLFTRLRLRDGAQEPWSKHEDHVGYACLHENQDKLWNGSGIIVRLRRLHLATAWGALALLTAFMRPRIAGWEMFDTGLAALSAVAVLLPLLLLAGLSLGSGRDCSWATVWIRYGCVALSTFALAGSGLRLGTIEDVGAFGVFLPVIRGSGVPLAAGFLILAVASAASGLICGVKDQTPKLSWINQPGMILNAASVATIFGAGAAMQAQRQLGGELCRQIESSVLSDCGLVVGSVLDWIAVGFTWLLIILVWETVVWFAIVWRKTDPSPQRFSLAIVRIASNPSAILRVLAINGFLGLFAALVVGGLTGFPPLGSLPGWVGILSACVLMLPLLAVAGLKLGGLLSRFGKGPAAVAAFLILAAAVGGVIWALQNHKRFGLLGLDLPPSTFLELAQLLTLVLPFSLVVSRFVYGGWRSREVRRGIGVLWDVGAFWPRWFHPFTPPTYSDRVVTDLTLRVDATLAAGKPILVSPHSQGAIIAAAAILGITHPSDRLALLTYGCPFSHLYAQGFPSVFNKACLGALCEKLAGSPDEELRWRNLYRSTDPIGGKINMDPPGTPRRWEVALNSVDVPLSDPCGRQHSGYPLEAEYSSSVARLKSMIGP